MLALSFSLISCEATHKLHNRLDIVTDMVWRLFHAKSFGPSIAHISIEEPVKVVIHHTPMALKSSLPRIQRNYSQVWILRMDIKGKVVQRGLGRTITETHGTSSQVCKRRLVVRERRHRRAYGHPLRLLRTIEQRLRRCKQSNRPHGVDGKDVGKFFGITISRWKHRLHSNGGVGDDNVQLRNALGLELVDGLRGISKGGRLDLDQNEFGTRSSGNICEAFGLGGGDVADTPDDNVAWPG